MASRRGPHPLSLFLGMATRICGPDEARLSRVLQGVRRYQDAPHLPARPEPPRIAQRGGVSLRSYGGPVGGKLLVVIPSLINAPAVLDLAPGRSLVEFLVGQGFRVALVDWGPIAQSERRLGLAGLVSVRLLPLLRDLEEPILLAGYCLGGTLALAAASRMPGRVEKLALIATPWHFDGFTPDARKSARAVWTATRPIGRQLGLLPVSLLNPLFWSLDETAVVAKFEALAAREADDPAVAWFALVEDWANSGAPLSLSASRDLFVHGFQNNRIGEGQWKVQGDAVRPEQISCPIFDIGATRDKIVPKEARIRLRRANIVRADVDSGHVGMVVGGSARKALWEPLSNWLRSP